MCTGSVKWPHPAIRTVVQCGAMKMCLRCLICVVVLLLAACAEATPPAPPPTTPFPTPPTPLGIASLLAQPTLPDHDVTVIGYLYAEGGNVVLTDGLSFSTGPQPRPLDDPMRQIWIELPPDTGIAATAQIDSSFSYRVVQAQGQLQGPGAFGPGGRYRYQFSPVQLIPLAPLEPTIRTLLLNPATYENRLVKISAGLLTRGNEALLVEQLNDGGIPTAESLQIKLNGPLRDQALLQRLTVSSSGSVHFGQVQVEGIWQQGMLYPLAIIPLAPDQTSPTP